MTDIENVIEEKKKSNTNTSQLLINGLKKTIRNGDVENTAKLLDKIDFLEQMNQNIIIKFMIFLLEECQLFNRYNIARKIIYNFDNVSDEVITDDSYFYQLFYDLRASDQLLAFMCKAFNRPEPGIESEVVTWSEVMDVFSKIENEEYIKFGCQRAENIYGEKDFQEYELFKVLGENTLRSNLEEYMEMKMALVSECTDEPEYVDDFYFLDLEESQGAEVEVDFEQIPRHNQILDLLPPKDIDNFVQDTLSSNGASVAEAYLEYLKYAGAKIESDKKGKKVNVDKTAKKAIMNKWKQLNDNDKMAFIDPIVPLLTVPRGGSEEEILIFRLMGPSNPRIEIVNKKDVDINVCTLFGCRMLYCGCGEVSNEYKDLEDNNIGEFDEEISWFKHPNEEYATCDYCNEKLELLSDAVRIPLVGGGWTGRFCNSKDKPFLCALDWLHTREENQVRHKDLIIRVMIDIISDQLNTYGIQRQKYNNQIYEDRGEQMNFKGTVKIDYIPGEIEKEDVKILLLDDEISGKVYVSLNLKEIDLNNKKLTSLPEKIGKLTQLSKLILSYNQLTSSNEITKLTKLEVLLIDNNKLTKLPDEIGELTNLTELDLESNQLLKIPKSIGKLTKLKYLSLENNKLVKLPKSIGNLTNLEELNLIDNKFFEKIENNNKLSRQEKNKKIKSLKDNYKKLLPNTDIYW